MSENLRTVLALSRLPRVGRARLRKVLGKLKTEEATDIDLTNAVDYLTDSVPQFSEADLKAAVDEADEVLGRCRSLSIAVHAYGWSSYPPQLSRLNDPPALLFSKGKFQFEQRPRIAVIGTRTPTPWGLKTAQACAAKVAERHGVVVSGLALGIDSAAQRASIQHNGPTWAVLAHGLHTVSPSSNKQLAEEIVEKGGALLSEYAPGERAQRHYFVERDRIQAGLSDAVLVIESGIDGGSMHTVRFAQQAHISVWATFPDAKIHDAEIDRDSLPEPQQGTWQLLRTRTAARVTTMKVLSQMMHDLPDVAEPTSGIS